MSEKRIVHFGAFQADLRTGELRRDGRRVQLQQQPFRLLRALLEHPGELVTREELRRTLWREGTFVSFERGLTSAMRKVREALGDRADVPTYIETLQGRGYRFIGDVTMSQTRVAHGGAALESCPVGAEPAAAASGSPSPQPPSTRRIHPGRWASAAVLTLVLTGGGRTPAPVQSDDRLAAADSLSAYACLLKSQGRFAEGLETIRRAQALAPESAKIAAEVGFHLHAAGQYDDEFPMLYKAVELDATSPDAWLHLGLAHARRGELTKAVAELERASALTTTDTRPAHWLAWIRAQKL